MTAVSLTIAALGLLQEATVPQGEIWWDLGLLARSVESSEISTENRFGGGWGWSQAFRTLDKDGLPAWQPGPVYEIEASDGRIVVRAGFTTGFAGESIVLEITGARVRAQVDRFSCVTHGPVLEAAGVVCLISDGVTSALDFEVFLAKHILGFSGIYGHVHLGAEGIALTEELLQRPIDPSQSPFESRSMLELAEGNESHGWLDVFGRRQGVWTLRDSGGCKRTEMTWSNGRPHGRFALWDEWGQLRLQSAHRDGFQHGECYGWHENGELAVIDHFVDDVPRGLRVDFDPDGAKTSESVSDATPNEGPSPQFLAALARLKTRD